MGGAENFLRIEISKHIRNQTRTLVIGGHESALSTTMMGINSALGVGVGLQMANEDLRDQTTQDGPSPPPPNGTG